MADESGSRGLFGRRKRTGEGEKQGGATTPETADEAAIAAAAEREALARLAEAEERAEGGGGDPSVSEPPPSQGAAEGAEELRRRLGERIDTARGVVPPPVEAEPPRPIEDPPGSLRFGEAAPSPEFVASAEHEAAGAGESGVLSDALAGEIAADLGAIADDPASGSAEQLERAESVIAAREARFEAALARARDRLSAAEDRASEVEQRAQRAEELTAFQERERRQAEELRAVLDRISEAEARARKADERISSLIEAAASPPELESLLSADPAADPAGPEPPADPEPPAPPLTLAPDPDPTVVPGLAATETAATDPATSPPVEPGVPEPPVHLSAAPEPIPAEADPDPPLPDPAPGAEEEVAPPEDPRIDLNEASSQDLRALGAPVIGIGRILAERERRGGFGSVDDLDAVKGLDPELLARLKAAMRVGGEPSA